MISTRGRYALRVLVDLAERGDEGFVPLKDIAQRQDLSEKYLQQILKLLVDAGMLKGASGRGGGYRMMRDPRDCSVKEVLELTEGALAPVACLAPGAEPCPQAPTCKTLPMWKEFDVIASEFFANKTIADLAGL